MSRTPKVRGALWGLGLASGISVVVVALFAAYDYWNFTVNFGSRTAYCSDGVCGPGSALYVFVPYAGWAFFLGLVPALLIGLVGGWLIGRQVPRKAHSEDEAGHVGRTIARGLCIWWLVLGLITPAVFGLLFIIPACFVCVALGSLVAKKVYANL